MPPQSHPYLAVGARQKFILQWSRRGDRVAEGGSLLSCCAGQPVPRVRIPPSPPLFFDCPLAQLEVRLTLDQEVLGSSPRGAANIGS